MITSKKNKKGFVNEITEYLDKYLFKCPNCTDLFYTYISDWPLNNEWTLRIPGRSVGYLKIEKGIINKIELYNDKLCYDRNVFKELNQFIGKPIDIK